MMGIVAMAPSKDGRMTSRSGGSCGRRGERTAEDVDFGFAPHSISVSCCFANNDSIE